jgi:pimeloyl-ACP methyl ester carboxylesterase
MGHHKKQSERGSYNYLLYLPEGYSKEQRDSWPLLLFLHGADRKGVNLDALRSSGIARLCEERLPQSCEGSSSPSSSSVACESQLEVDESSCASTVDVDVEDADGDSPRTATAGLHLSRASALAQRSLHRRTPSLSGGTPALPRMQSFPFVVVSPLCPPFKYWRVESLASLLEEVAERYRVDRRRIYAIGEGMGGWAVCALAAHEPQRLAACVPIGAATGPNFVDVNRLKETPLWIFHGCSNGVGSDDIVADADDDDHDFEFDEPELNDGDGAVKSDEGLRASLSLVQALRRQGARSVLFTTYPTTAPSPSVGDSTDSLPGVSSFSGSCGDSENELVKRTYTYDNPLLYQWLLQHTLPLLDV